MILISMQRVACAAMFLTLGATILSAGEVPHLEKTVGQVIFQRDPTPENPVGRQEFIAVGHGTHLGQYTQVGAHDFYPDGTLEGEFESTASDGATISGVYSGSFAPIGGGLFEFNVTAVWLDGTGRLAGVAGSGDVRAILDSATGIVTYETDATWELP